MSHNDIINVLSAVVQGRLFVEIRTLNLPNVVSRAKVTGVTSREFEGQPVLVVITEGDFCAYIPPNHRFVGGAFQIEASDEPHPIALWSVIGTEEVLAGAAKS